MFKFGNSKREETHISSHFVSETRNKFISNFKDLRDFMQSLTDKKSKIARKFKDYQGDVMNWFDRAIELIEWENDPKRSAWIYLTKCRPYIDAAIKRRLFNEEDLQDLKQFENMFWDLE